MRRQGRGTLRIQHFVNHSDDPLGEGDSVPDGAFSRGRSLSMCNHRSTIERDHEKPFGEGIVEGINCIRTRETGSP